MADRKKLTKEERTELSVGHWKKWSSSIVFFLLLSYLFKPFSLICFLLVFPYISTDPTTDRTEKGLYTGLYIAFLIFMLSSTVAGTYIMQQR